MLVQAPGCQPSSAGILMYRRTGPRLEVLLVHPGGPFWRNKDEGAWSIPKGEMEENEDAAAAARREFLEETGCALSGPLEPLGEVRQRGGKRVTAFAVEADLDVDAIKSNSFEIEWSKKHRNQWPSSLKRYAYPTIGQLNIGEIKPSHIFDLLKPIWVEKRETANRVRGRIETIIAKNIDVDDTDFRNPAELTRQLREKLPKRPKRAVQHHPALPSAEMPQFMAALSGAAGRAAAMLRFLIFTSCRTNEVVASGWSEID
jgi:predicted NUDIX family NTP pyrophosphohydrolase